MAVEKQVKKLEINQDPIIVKLDIIIDKIDNKIDLGLRKERLLIIRMFTFVIVFTAISFITLFAKVTGIF